MAKSGNRITLLVSSGVMLAACTIAYITLRPPAPGPGGDPPTVEPPTVVDAEQPKSQGLPSFDTEQYRIAIAAVAATEEGEFERARTLWAKLTATHPDIDIRINEAVTILKWIDVLNSELGKQETKSDPTRQSELRNQIETAFQVAESVTTRLSDVSQSDFRIPLVQASILTSRAEQSEFPENTSYREQAARILAAALDEDAAQPYLVVAFDEALQGLAGSTTELESKLPGFLFAAFQAQPDNLYLLKRAAESLQIAKDPRLKELLQPTIDLTRPMWSLHQRYVDILKPESLIPEVAAAIDNGDWATTGKIRRWLNIILGMSGFRDDNRRVDPDPLALLDTSFLQRYAPKETTGETTGESNSSLGEFESTSSANRFDAVAWYDFDFDLRYEAVAGKANTLTFLQVQEDSLVPQKDLTVSKPITGILPIDLFEVRAPSAPKLPGSVAELMLDSFKQTSTDGETQPQNLTDDTVASATATEDATIQQTGSTSGARHSSLQELLLWGDEGFEIVTWQQNEFSLVEDETGLETFRGITLVEPADIESDGDLDLMIVAENSLRLLQNNGNRTFRDISEFCQLPASDIEIRSSMAVDFDRDLDQDFLLATNRGVAILENILHSQFRFRLLSGRNWEQVTDAASLTINDFDNNRSWDIAISRASGASLVSTVSPTSGQIAATRAQTISTPNATVILSEDMNNDGHLDLILQTAGGVQVVTGKENGQFAKPTTAHRGAITQLQAIDRDYDGRIDLLCLSEGHATIVRALDAPSGNYNVVRLAGINDGNGGGRINHYGLGSTIEIWTDSQVLTRTVRSPVTHFGLGASRAENLRVVFTNGLTQNTEQIPPDMLVEEIQLMRGSCPYVYGYDGEKFELITDLLWNAPLGLQVARGVTLRDRRWEHLLLPGELVQPVDGAIELRITEELWEVAYFDQVRLSAIDHPEDVHVFTNEKVGPPEIAQHQIFALRQAAYARRAVDASGRDWTEQLKNRDRNYAQPFTELLCQGLATPHYIELDFGDLPTDSPELKLVLTGWLYPTDTSLNIGIAQDSGLQGPEPPSLWVVDENGQWVCARPFMGFPGGKPKSIVIDLNGIFQSDDQRIRVAGSQQIYWDEAFVNWEATGTHDFYETRMAIETAQLDYRGFSQPLPRKADQPHWFDYQTLCPEPTWPQLSGPFTRYGDVASTLHSDDDRMVVMKGGDEIKLRFKPIERNLPDGWVRDYVLYSTGWDKDADINTLEGQSSLPLPFMAQTSYPASSEQEGASAAVFEKNADTLTRYSQPASRSYQAAGGWLFTPKKAIEPGE